MDFGQHLRRRPARRARSLLHPAARRTTTARSTSSTAPRRPIFNAGNPGGAPVRSDHDHGPPGPTRPRQPLPGGIRVDMAAAGRAGLWAVRTVAGAEENATRRPPGEPGYGDNPRRRQQGRLAASNFGSNHLATLGDLNLYDGIPAPPTTTPSSTPPSPWPPSPSLTNLGTGMHAGHTSQLRHLFATGRLPSGENLIVVTRDSGSGTRNGFCNSIGLDPSFGIGENIGALSAPPAPTTSGRTSSPATRAAPAAWKARSSTTASPSATPAPSAASPTPGSPAAALEILAVQQRPDPAARSLPPDHRRHPRQRRQRLHHRRPGDLRHHRRSAHAPARHGRRRGQHQPRHAQPRGRRVPQQHHPLHRGLRRRQPGNATRPSFTPGEFLATQLILAAATDNIQNRTAPTTCSPTPASTRICRTSPAPPVLGNALSPPSAPPPSTARSRPARPASSTPTASPTAPTTSPGRGERHVRLQPHQPQPHRRRLQRRRQARDINDAAEMLRASHSATAAPPGPPRPAPALSPALRCRRDHRGPGRLQRRRQLRLADVRYWADGLAIDPAAGNLDRERASTPSTTRGCRSRLRGNFFGTTRATPKSYAAGDAAGDVAGSSGIQTPGFPHRRRRRHQRLRHRLRLPPVQAELLRR